MSAIDKKYAELGGASGFLGKPTTMELICPDGVGHYRHYKYGSIYWHPKTGAHEVHGAIREKWAKLGWERSFLGYPLTDETKTPDGKGRFNHFQGGSIYWHPKTSAYEVHGAIREKWAEMGWEKSYLGYPLTDETETPDGKGRFNHFQSGSIYWHPKTGVYVMPSGVKKVRIHAVVTGNDGSTGTTSPTFTTSFTLQTLIHLINEVKKIFINKAGIIIDFDPKTDVTEVKSALLNEDVPFKNGKIVVPPKSVDDLTGNPNVVAQRAFAQNLKGNLVIYFRDFSHEKYSYIDEKGEKKRDVPWNFSGSQHLYVRVTKGLGSPKLAHEIGHYFHLWHPFGPDPKSISDAANMIKDAVESKKFSKKDGALVFDGDRGSNVYDTPPDPRGSVMAEVNNGNGCGPTAVALVPVTFSDGSKKTYHLTPDRMNIMSYFDGCQNVNTAHFSAQQIDKMHPTMESGNRKHLLSQLPGRYTAAWRPGTPDERIIYGWEYKYFRMKYDELWRKGWRLHILENHVIKGEVLYTAIFRKSKVPEIQLYGWSYNAFRKKYDQLWKQGWRLYILNNYVLKGKVLYTAAFHKSKAPEIQLYGWTYQDYRKKYDELWEQGWRLYILNNYVLNGKVRYTAVFRKSKAPEVQLYGWTYENYRKRYDELWKQDWRLHILNNYVVNGKVRYTAVFRKSNSAEIQLYGWKYRQFRERFDGLWSKGMRIEILNIY